jgi:hypothetical protein
MVGNNGSEYGYGELQLPIYARCENPSAKVNGTVHLKILNSETSEGWNERVTFGHQAGTEKNPDGSWKVYSTRNTNLLSNPNYQKLTLQIYSIYADCGTYWAEGFLHKVPTQIWLPWLTDKSYLPHPQPLCLLWAKGSRVGARCQNPSPRAGEGFGVRADTFVSQSAWLP